MFGWLVRRQIAAFERKFDYDASYLRDIYDASPRAFWNFSRVPALARPPKDVPREAWYAATITAALSEDCGPCTQLGVTMAERAGVNSEILRAIVAEDVRALPPDAALGYRFAKSVLNRDLAESDRLRSEVVSRWGEKALVSLALGIAATRVFPGVKYALGHARACSRVRVAGADIPVAKQAAHA